MIIIQIHQGFYADLSIDNFQSFKSKAGLVGKIANAANNNSFVKDTKLLFQ